MALRAVNIALAGKSRPDSPPISRNRGTIVAAAYWFHERSAKSRSWEQHCARVSGGQRGLRPSKPWRGRAEKSGNLGNPHVEKMLQRRSQPIHE
jgi:hypothetical protein